MLLIQKLIDIAQHLSSMCGEESPPIGGRYPIPVRRLDLYDRDEIVDPVDEDIQTTTPVPLDKARRRVKEDGVLRPNGRLFDLASPICLDEPMKLFAAPKKLWLHNQHCDSCRRSTCGSLVTLDERTEAAALR